MTLTALALTATTVALADDPRPDPPPVRVWVSSAYQPPYDRSNRERPRVGKPQASDSGRPRAAVAKPLPRDRQNVAALALAVPQARPLDRCRGAQQAIGYYRRAYTVARERMGLEGAPPRAWYACQAARRRAVEWRTRSRHAVAELAEWRHYQYAWWDWMPRGWQMIGACETGYGRRPGNFRHNSGTYQGFAGFYHGSWDAFVSSADPKAGPYPSEAYDATPRQQYEVALAIYRRYGLSGWGCRGAYYR